MSIAMTLRASPAFVCALMLCVTVSAQTPPASPAPAPTLQSLAWLEGCWRGAVNKRDFREHWAPLRGELMVGVSHTVMDGKTLDFEYLRLEPRADGVYYVTSVPGQKDAAYRLTGTSTDKGDIIWTFTNPAQEFPKTISYRQGTEGWLYATVEGRISGADRTVIYPMRRIGCESGELIKK
jgi:hypothetical protein